jgi:hypothetical protein
MSLLLDATTWPAWQPEIESSEGPERMMPGDVARGRARMLGFHVDGHSTATTTGELSFEEDVIVGVPMTIRYEVETIPEGVRITHRLTSRLPGGPSGWLLSLVLRARLRRMQRLVLENLARQLEAGS